MAKSVRSRPNDKYTRRFSIPNVSQNSIVKIQSSSLTILFRPLSNSLRWLLTGGGIVLLLIPVLWYYDIVWKNAFNYPFEDDFDSLLKFINVYTDSKTDLWKKLQLIFAQHNEHRIVFDRLIFLLQYYIEGKVNIRTIILIGNCALLFLLIILFSSSLRSTSLPLRILYFIPVGYILFTLHFWELTVWGMASLQNLYVLVFIFTSLFLLHYPSSQKLYFGTACFMAILATFTSGNGLFTFPVGALVLWFLAKRHQLVIWFILFILTAGLYFFNFSRAEDLPSVYDSLVGNTSRAIDYFFTLTGSIFSSSTDASNRSGKVMFGIYLGLLTYLLLSRRIKDYSQLLSYITFLYITALLLTATRSGFGVIQATSPRYGIISVLIVSGLGLLLIDVIQHRWLKPTAALLFTAVSLYLFNLTADLNEIKVSDRNRILNFCAALYNDNPQNLLVYWGTSQKEGQAILNDSFRRKTYQVPKVTLSDLASKPFLLSNYSLQPEGTITVDAQPFETNNFIVFWNTWAVADGIDTHRMKTEVIAQSADKVYSFETSKHMRYDVANQMQSISFVESGFSCVLNKSALSPGQYSLWLHLTDSQTHAYKNLNQGFSIK